MYCLLQPALAETVKVDDVRSLQAALDKARVNKRIARIELAAGTYALRAPIVVDERLSGTAATPFVLAGATGARPVLTGAENLASLHWEAWNGGIWGAKLEDKDFQQKIPMAASSLVPRPPTTASRPPARTAALSRTSSRTRCARRMVPRPQRRVDLDLLSRAGWQTPVGGPLPGRKAGSADPDRRPARACAKYPDREPGVQGHRTDLPQGDGAAAALGLEVLSGGRRHDRERLGGRARQLG
jgi:hypothetical protein